MKEREWLGIIEIILIGILSIAEFNENVGMYILACGIIVLFGIYAYFIKSVKARKKYTDTIISFKQKISMIDMVVYALLITFILSNINFENNMAGALSSFNTIAIVGLYICLFSLILIRLVAGIKMQSKPVNAYSEGIVLKDGILVQWEDIKEVRKVYKNNKVNYNLLLSDDIFGPSIYLSTSKDLEDKTDKEFKQRRIIIA